MRAKIALLAILAAAPWALAEDHLRPFKFTPPDEKLLADANELDRQFEAKGFIYHDPKADAWLTAIGGRLTPPAPERVTYRFHFLRDAMVNAFALPNGSIYINTGLVAAMQNESELAAVMSHEITHVVNRHSYLQNRSIRKKAVTMDVVVFAGSLFPFGGTVGLAAQGSQVFIIASVYGYSRELESEADTSGYGRLIRADYDGNAMAQSFELLDERLEFEPIEPFWRTHPKLQSRIATAKKLVATENTPHPRITSTKDYLDHVAPVIRENIAFDLDNRRFRTAVARAERLVEWDPSNASDRTLLADAYRSLGAKSPRPNESEHSEAGRRLARNRMLKLTAEEEQRQLLGTSAGKAALEVNQQRAETLYKEAIDADPSLAAAHRGLGMLYQDQSKWSEAAREYQKYLALASPDAPDRLRIEHRLEDAQKK